MNRAVRAPPMCSMPVGDGAKRVTTEGDLSAILGCVRLLLEGVGGCKARPV